jgi:hypothetical protein
MDFRPRSQSTRTIQPRWAWLRPRPGRISRLGWKQHAACRRPACALVPGLQCPTMVRQLNEREGSALTCRVADGWGARPAWVIMAVPAACRQIVLLACRRTAEILVACQAATQAAPLRRRLPVVAGILVVCPAAALALRTSRVQQSCRRKRKAAMHPAFFSHLLSGSGWAAPIAAPIFLIDERVLLWGFVGVPLPPQPVHHHLEKPILDSAITVLSMPRLLVRGRIQSKGRKLWHSDK